MKYLFKMSLRPHHVSIQILVRGERRAEPLAPLTHITFKSLQPRKRENNIMQPTDLDPY
jgi:hypothetical protein